MTNILYRSSTTSTPPLVTSAKGSPITTVEFDANLKSLSDDIQTKAPINSPALVGTPTAPTAGAGVSTNQIATTAFVAATIGVINATKADLNSPVLVGTPTAPTAPSGTNSTQLANTAYVIAERNESATLTNKTLTAPSITSPSITNPSITNPQYTEQTLVDAPTVNWNMNNGHVAIWTITAVGRVLAAPTNYRTGGQYQLLLGIVNPATMTPTWPAIIKWNYDIPPDLTTSSWTVISLVWSITHGKFLGSYAPGF